MATLSNHAKKYSGRLPVLLLGLLALALGSVAALALLDDAYSPPVWMLVEYSVTLLLPAVLMYGAYWLATGDFTPDELWRTLWWTVGGIVTLAVTGGFVLLHRHFEGVGLVEPIFLVALLSLLGGVVGFAVAVAHLHTARVVESSLESERADTSEGECSQPRDQSERTEIRDIDGPELLRSRTQEQSLTRQWAALKAVAACGDCSLDELATMLARDPRNSFPSDSERVKSRLYHQYLPAIAESGLVEFDSATKFVRYAGPETLTG